MGIMLKLSHTGLSMLKRHIFYASQNHRITNDMENESIMKNNVLFLI